MWPFAPGYPEANFGDLLERYDYIIVGGGTAGCVLANRLSALPENMVLLIERGPVADNWASRVPLLSSDFSSHGTGSRRRMSEYQPELGRSVELVHGSALGGTSRINQMVYTRGLPREYDMWAEGGCAGWGWEDVEPLFRKSERFLEGHNDGDYHGQKGEWANRTGPSFFPGFEHVIESCKKIGLSFIDDLNSPKSPPIGCGQLHFTRDENQLRNSAYHAFLPGDLVKQRRNLHILPNAIVEKLLIGRRGVNSLAEGVQIVPRNSTQRKFVKSNREVILCAGPFGSPQLLLLSGIGPAGHLKEHGIQVHKNLPAVGENLDHFGVSIAYHIPMNHSLVSLQRCFWIFFIELSRWFIWGTGMLLAPVIQLALFASSVLLDARGYPVEEKEGANTIPDIEVLPMAYYSGDTPFDKSRGIFSFLCIHLHPKSKGTVRLTSTKPDAPLKINPQYLSNPEDFIPLRASLKLALRIAEGMRARGYPIEDWPTEMPHGDDNESLDKFIRKRNRSTYHYSSTCRMGPREDIEDGGAVVDGSLKVFGVDGLRIADSSIFPSVPGVHLQAPTVMVAEKCAEIILNPKD